MLWLSAATISVRPVYLTGSGNKKCLPYRQLNEHPSVEKVLYEIITFRMEELVLSNNFLRIVWNQIWQPYLMWAQMEQFQSAIVG